MHKLLLALALACAPSLALAQGAVLQGGPWTGGHIPQYVGQGAPGGQAVLSDGGAAAGGAIGANVGEIGVVARGTGTAPYAGQGTGPYGTNVCDYDAPTNNATGYHFLCFSANAQGGGLLAYGAGGVATPGNLQFIVNGAAYTFPFTGAGGGNVVGPGTSTVNDIATFNNVSGTLLKDSGISLGSQSQNFVLATPNGSSGVPSFRALAFGDLPITGTPLAGYAPIGAGSTASWQNLYGGTTPWTAVQTFDAGIAINTTGLTQGYVGSQTISGTSAGSFSANNELLLSSATLTGGASFLNGRQLTCGLTSTSVQGGVNCLYVTFGLNSPTSGSNVNRNYVGITGIGQANSSDNGTDTGAGSRGAIFASGFLSTAENGATNLTEISAGEADCGISTGASAKLLLCWSVVALSTHAVHGASADYAVGVGAEPGSIGFNGAYMITNNNGQFPLSLGATIMGSDAVGNVTNGIDWHLVACSGDWVQFSNVYTVDCTGNVVSTGFAIHNGVVQALHATAIPAGGMAADGFTFFSTANFGMFGGSGAPTLSAAQGSIYLRSDGLPYYNTNGTTGWGQLAPTASPVFSGVVTAPQISNGSSPLIVGSSTGTIQIGTTGAFTANGAVATAMSSVGPTGSHTTIQKWLTITEADGTTVGYIPVF